MIGFSVLSLLLLGTRTTFAHAEEEHSLSNIKLLLPHNAVAGPGDIPRPHPSANTTVSVGTGGAPVPQVQLRDGHWMPMIGIGMCCRPTAEGQAATQSTLDWYNMSVILVLQTGRIFYIVLQMLGGRSALVGY